MSPVTGWSDEFPNDEQVILMQYTGLHDKNGKEIFEGDIVVPFYTVAGYGSKQVVRWGIGAWEPFNGNCDSDHTDRYEIIGNIHQNPELREEVGKEVS